MKKTVRAHQEPLSEPLARSLLAMPGKDGVPLYGKLQAALTALKEAVSEANEQLRDNPLTPIVAREAARQLGRRGDAAIRVDPSGVVFLEVGQVTETAPEDKREWTTKYPSLQTLRAAAAKLGIDTAPMGRSKRQIVDAIRKAKAKTATRPAPAPTPAPEVSPPEPPKMVRTAPAISQPVVVQMTEQGQVVPASPPAPPPSPAQPAKKIGGRTLSQIAEAAESEVDLDAIFAKPVPPQPPSD